jgi:hypothetical protein
VYILSPIVTNKNKTALIPRANNTLTIKTRLNINLKNFFMKQNFAMCKNIKYLCNINKNEIYLHYL